jgi:hypothetical protein
MISYLSQRFLNLEAQMVGELKEVGVVNDVERGIPI